MGVDLEEFDNVELYQAMAEDVLPYLDVSAEAVIVDPSRASLEKRVIEVILDWSPRRPVYVSCDPSMLDRDADISLQVVTGRFKTRHLFPQACYIESVSPFEKG